MNIEKVAHIHKICDTNCDLQLTILQFLFFEQIIMTDDLFVNVDFITSVGKKINEILIEKYDIKYSTIVIFDGSEYVIKASNVSEKHYPPIQ